MKMKSILFLNIICICFQNAFAQEAQTINDTIYSEVLNEEREITIKLPVSYDQESNEKYDVIYLTDGEWNEYPFSFIYKFAQDESYVPPAIIVSVKNKYIDGANQRDRDFLPVKVPQPAISGGADNFLDFLEQELMPYINTNYKTNGHNSLYGHSYGGLFTAYALLTRPAVFDYYYATDPAFWFNDEYIIQLAGEKLESLPPGKVFWVAGITESHKGMKIDKMDSVLQAKAPENLHWKVVTYPNEKHNSVRLKAMYDGIKYVYSGYTTSPMMIHPMGGTLMPDSAIGIFIQNQGNARYTLDGSTPTSESMGIRSLDEIKGPVQLSVKSFSTSGRYDHLISEEFKTGEAVKSVKKTRKAEAGGLRYSFYKGSFEKIPDFDDMKPEQKGIANDTFRISKLGDTDLACLFEGYLEIDQTGNYIFFLRSDDGSRLYINEQLIINNDGIKTQPEPKSYVVPLEVGFHQIRIEYFQYKDGKDFSLRYVKPNRYQSERIPNSKLYH